MLTLIEIITVEGLGGYTRQRGRYQCSRCGSIIVRRKWQANHMQSCGCNAGHNRTHGLSPHPSSPGHPLFTVWWNMKLRCYNPKGKSYKNYGGRGITICKEWRQNLAVFAAWALANGWQRGLTIERINNNGNYEPSNCRFIPHAQQARNKRSNKLTLAKVLEIRGRFNAGERECELVRAFGVCASTINKVVRNISWKDL